MILSRRWEHVFCTCIIHRNITQGTLLYYSTDTEVKASICNRKRYDVPKHNKHLKSESFFWPMLMEVIIRCLYLGCSKLPLKLA